MLRLILLIILSELQYWIRNANIKVKDTDIIGCCKKKYLF